jgi:hypothetical protein
MNPIIDWFDSAEIWFKIDHAGKYEDGTWAADMFVPPNNQLYSVTIPPKLKPGQYLIRHEMYVVISVLLLSSEALSDVFGAVSRCTGVNYWLRLPTQLNNLTSIEY